MKYNRGTLENIHNEIKFDIEKMRLTPHKRKANLTNTIDFDGFFTLRYWRIQDAFWLQDKWYNQSNIEIAVNGEHIYIGVWFGLNNKEIIRVSKHSDEILKKLEEYSDYQWMDEKGNIPNKPLIEWLCEKSHETVLRKELSQFDKDNALKDISHLKELLEILLSK